MSRESRRNGMLAMTGAVFMFAIMDATLKRLASSYEPFQLACIRCLASLLVILPILLWQGRIGELIPRQPLWHMLRAALGILTLTMFVYAVRQLSLGSTYAIYLCAPLIVAALSATLIGHRVSARHWVAIFVGLSGVLLILRPFAAGSLSAAGVFAAMVSATAYSLNLLTVSRMSARNSNTSLVFWFLLLVGAMCGAVAGPRWQAVPSADYPWLALIGVSGALGQYGVTRALQLAPAFVVAPIEYTAIVWALAIDTICWSKPLTALTLVGGALVVVSGARLDVSAEPSRNDGDARA